MQVQGVNGVNGVNGVTRINNNNTNFKALKGFIYADEFNPKTTIEHAKIADKVLNSDAIKEFGKRYDFLARLTYKYLYEPITMTCYVKPFYYSLELIPIPVQKPKSPSSTIGGFFKSIFGRNKKEALEESPKEENAQKETNKNLPKCFTIKNVLKEYGSEAYEEVINDIANLTPEKLERKLQLSIDQTK